MRRVGMVTVVVALAATPLSAVAQSDHLKCYKMKDPVKLAGVLAVNSVQFGAESGCKVSKALRFCVPATKTVVSAEDQATDLPIAPLPVTGVPTSEDRICYKLQCDASPADQQVTDQFGTRTFTKLKTSMVCTPAAIGTGYCGDGIKNGSEQCDTADIGAATCADAGYSGGTLACGQGCVLDMSGCSCSASTGALPATGQTTCMSSAGFVIPCADTGHDGDIQAGATLDYTDNGDGTITDNNTGLMWEKLSDDGSIHDLDNTYTWNDAFAVKVATLNSGSFAGYTDWRLPNAKELHSIVNYEFENYLFVSPAFINGCTGGCSVTTCSCARANLYWSSSTNAANPMQAWYVNFGGGVVVGLAKTASLDVRAVRGGS